MKKKHYIYILFLFILACKNNGNNRNSARITINQNKSQIDTILQVIKHNIDNENHLDTTKYKAVKTEFNERSIKLNNKAIKLYSYVSGMPVSKHDSLLLDSALILLNKSIKIDTQYYLAYANKAMILSKFKKYTKAIKTLSDIVKIRPNYAEGIANQGFLYEKMGNYNKAKELYEESIQAYLRRLNDPSIIIDRVDVQTDIAFMVLFTSGKDVALQLIDTLAARNPDNKVVKLMKANITMFNRKEFISNF